MADLFHRVSIRKYQDRPVEREKIVEILRAVMAAPSAKNQQPWEFYVITKKIHWRNYQRQVRMQG